MFAQFKHVQAVLKGMYGADWSATLSAYARLNSMRQTMNRSPFSLQERELHGQHYFNNIARLQNTMLNPKIHCKSKNTIQLQQ